MSPLSRILARRGATTSSPRSSRSDRPERTLCLVAHMDTSRSGLIFDPRVVAGCPLDCSQQPARLGAASFALIIGLAIAPALLSVRRRFARIVLATAAAAGLASEGALLAAPISSVLSRRRSGNVVATIEPSGVPERTLCLMAHMDTSRSGLIFHPRVVSLMARWIAANSLLVLAAAVLEPFAGRFRSAPRLLAAIRLGLAGSLGLLAEREFRGVDVPGRQRQRVGLRSRRLAGGPPGRLATRSRPGSWS